MANTYGIEAALRVIEKEIKDVFAVYGKQTADSMPGLVGVPSGQGKRTEVVSPAFGGNRGMAAECTGTIVT